MCYNVCHSRNCSCSGDFSFFHVKALSALTIGTAGALELYLSEYVVIGNFVLWCKKENYV